MKLTQLHFEQKINTDLSNLWEFISSPKNLSKITPNYMDFNIKSKIPNKMYEGLIISYTVKPILGIKLNWVTEITHIKDKNYFVDEQRSGPYKMWHHEHILEETNDGIIMKDIISYIPPYGIIGLILNKLFIKKQVKEIFQYRTKILDNIFKK
ncbi:MAG: hypothetical protein CMD02_00805 [Flavobacteriales bacterium]|nr:hypothetical protein [Flavobacteriales bacterium]|tara:strand:- start:905 stop:1363 length:459 start_codon:yes stop_codon:yes gene_type:complete